MKSKEKLERDIKEESLVSRDKSKSDSSDYIPKTEKHNPKKYNS